MKNNTKNLVHNDEIGLSWNPLTVDNHPFPTKKLVSIYKSRYFYRPTIGSLFFPAVLFYFSYVLSRFLLESKFIDFVSYFAAFVCFLPSCIGLKYLYKNLEPIVFSKNFNLFWAGYLNPIQKNSLKNSKKLDQIIAIQLLWKLSESHYIFGYIYELNIVLETKERVNIISHMDRNLMIKEAEILAKFLNVPLYYRT